LISARFQGEHYNLDITKWRARGNTGDGDEAMARILLFSLETQRLDFLKLELCLPPARHASFQFDKMLKQPTTHKSRLPSLFSAVELQAGVRKPQRLTNCTVHPSVAFSIISNSSTYTTVRSCRHAPNAWGGAEAKAAMRASDGAVGAIETGPALDVAVAGAAHSGSVVDWGGELLPGLAD
jgi:hypothetical protein